MQRHEDRDALVVFVVLFKRKLFINGLGVVLPIKNPRSRPELNEEGAKQKFNVLTFTTWFQDSLQCKSAGNGVLTMRHGKGVSPHETRKSPWLAEVMKDLRLHIRTQLLLKLETHPTIERESRFGPFPTCLLSNLIDRRCQVERRGLVQRQPCSNGEGVKVCRSSLNKECRCAS